MDMAAGWELTPACPFKGPWGGYRASLATSLCIADTVGALLGSPTLTTQCMLQPSPC